MIAKLSDQGVAGFVLANGSMSTNTKGPQTVAGHGETLFIDARNFL